MTYIGDVRVKALLILLNTTLLSESIKIDVSKRLLYRFVLLVAPTKTTLPTCLFGEGPGILYKYRCRKRNCFFTYDSQIFKGSLEKFDAVIFNGHYAEKWNKLLPKTRYPHQKYVFASSEPAVLHPICTDMFNSFFNWTFTYKLDSDIVLSYFTVSDGEGNVVAPKQDVTWINNTKTVDVYNDFAVGTKTKAVVYFVSDDGETGDKNKFVAALRTELQKFNYTLDIYKSNYCSTSRNCDDMLQNDYYFYLALEYANSEDYVTDNVLRAYYNNLIPIVYGGADYSRFLPPNSYLDGMAQTTAELAEKMHKMIKEPGLYRKYFEWMSHYAFKKNGIARAICKFCEMINDDEIFGNYSWYGDFREWWSPNYFDIC